MKRNKVFDFSKYRRCEYDSQRSQVVNLGDVMYKHSELPEEDKGQGYAEDEIGVVIQTFDTDEFRVDMWGMTTLFESSFATKAQIKKFRPNVLIDLVD